MAENYSQSVGSSPVSGSVLTAQTLEPALDSVSPSLSAPPRLALSLSKINKTLREKKRNPVLISVAGVSLGK